MIHVLILAGGGGSRLWPFSTEAKPKQFLCFDSSQKSLLQKTIQRVLHSPHIQEIVILTQEKYQTLVEKEIALFSRKIPILLEPCSKNTAPAISLGVKYLEDILHIPRNEKILVLPSDHWISPESLWLEELDKIFQIEEKKIITFGIRPTRPETGFGYLKTIPSSDTTYPVETFVEKPCMEKALSYIESDRYFWNCGMFYFSIQTFWNELREHAPSLYSFGKKDFSEMQHSFSEMPSISIDYAVMEKTKNISMYPLKVQWSDVGSWDGVYDLAEKDLQGNILMGNVAAIDTKNCLLATESQNLCIAGLEDILVVSTKEGLFLAKKGDSQKLKKLLDMQQEKSKEKTPSLSWGKITTLMQEDSYVVRKIQIFPQKASSPFLKKAQYTILSGSLLAIFKDKVVKHETKESFFLNEEDVYFENTSSTDVLLLECEYVTEEGSSIDTFHKLSSSLSEGKIGQENPSFSL